MKIQQMLIKKGTKGRPGTKIAVKYITVHETDNEDAGANANAHARLQANGNSREASWHYQVDDKEIWQSIPDNERALHAGDGKGPGNNSSVAVEICVNKDGNFSKATDNAAWLVAQLLKKHKLSISRVVQHSKWSGKNCPRRLRKSGWSAFLKAVESYMGGKKPSTPAKWDGKSFPGRDAFKIGKSHPAVTVLGQRLVAHGFGGHYKVGPGPTFTAVDKKACAAFQRAQGWTGSDADGFPGPVTWERLMKQAKGEKKPAPKPTPQPDPKKDDWIRVSHNGKQVNAFKDPKNAVREVEKYAKPGTKIDVKGN